MRAGRRPKHEVHAARTGGKSGPQRRPRSIAGTARARAGFPGQRRSQATRREGFRERAGVPSSGPVSMRRGEGRPGAARHGQIASRAGAAGHRFRSQRLSSCRGETERRRRSPPRGGTGARDEIVAVHGAGRRGLRGSTATRPASGMVVGADARPTDLRLSGLSHRGGAASAGLDQSRLGEDFASKLRTRAHRGRREDPGP